MKVFIFICLLFYLKCIETIGSFELVDCLVKIPGYKDDVMDIYDPRIIDNYKQIYLVSIKLYELYKEPLHKCLNEIYEAIDFVCKNPVRNVQCIIRGGIPKKSPYYSNIYDFCRRDFCY